MTKDLIIALDFDGTICKHTKFPNVGPPVPGAIDWIKKYDELGARQFLWSCRNGQYLGNAIEYLEENGVILEGYNDISYGSKAFAPYPKLFANIYIDDAAIGVPLIYTSDERAYLDWDVVGPAVEARIIKKQRHV